MDPAVALARVPSRPTRTDALMVLVLLAWAVGEQLSLNGATDLLPGLGYAVAVTVPLLWHRQHPVLALAVVAVASAVRILVPPVGEPGAAPFPSLLVLTFSLALHVRPLDRAALLGAVPVAVMTALSAAGFYGPFSVLSVLILAFFVGGAWALGRTVLRSADSVRAEQAGAVEKARAAVEEERTRIARELHDVVAHAVSIVVVQAGAAEALVDKDPAAAKKHLAAVRRTGREALAEMRQLLHVLREGEATYVPQPGLSTLSDLAEEVTRAGTPVTLDIEPGIGDLPAGLELCAFRVVQEALTNVRKHAPGAPTTVQLHTGDQQLSVVVRNEATRAAPTGWAGGGHGLAGMAERVRLYGGELEATPSLGGFLVHARIPLEVPT